jgi:hypothetical protein
MSDLKIIKLKIIGLKALAVFTLFVPLLPLTLAVMLAYALAAVGGWVGGKVDELHQWHPVNRLLSSTIWRMLAAVEELEYEHMQKLKDETDG